jgi:hypothetical protein
MLVNYVLRDESPVAYTGSIGDVENQGWGPSYGAGKRGPFSMPKQTRHTMMVLLLEEVAYHT